MVKDESEIYGILANEGASTRAGRLVGAFRNIGRDKIANNILGLMKRLGYDVREEDPFEDKVESISPFPISPYVARINAIKVHHVVRIFGYPYFRFPGDVIRELSEFLLVFKGRDNNHFCGTFFQLLLNLHDTDFAHLPPCLLTVLHDSDSPILLP